MIRKRGGLIGWVILVCALCFLGAAFIVGMIAGGAHGAALQRGELELLARVVQAESSGEPEPGARAVAWTVINRLDEPETYGRTITKVILRAHQYATPVPLDDASGAYLRALLATTKVLLGEGGDPSLGSTHFFRKDMRPWPAWSRHMERRAVIGNHVFMREAD